MIGFKKDQSIKPDSINPSLVALIRGVGKLAPSSTYDRFESREVALSEAENCLQIKHHDNQKRTFFTQSEEVLSVQDIQRHCLSGDSKSFYRVHP